MGLGSFLGKALSVAGTAASLATGNPLFAMGGNLLAGATGKGDSPTGNTGYANMDLPNIAIPGVNWPGGGVRMPTYPALPQATNIPTMANPSLQGPTQGERGAGKALAVAQLLQLLTLNPNNPITKNLASAQEQQSDAAYADALGQAKQASQRARGQGRQGFFNPERGSQDFMTALTQQAAQNRLGAMQGAQTQMNQVSGNMRNLASSYQQQGNMEQNRQNTLTQQQQDYMSQLRANFATLLGQQRGDITNNVDLQRKDILDALNMARNYQTTGTQNVNAANQAKDMNLMGMLNYLGNKGSGYSGVPPTGFGQSPLNGANVAGFNSASGASLPWLQ